MRVVTTFSKDGYQLYGKRMLESLLRYWPSATVAAYHESQPETFLHDRLTWRNLDSDTDRYDFIKKHSTPDKIGTVRDPNSQSIRFCHKVFALTAEASTCTDEWLLWIDADVVFTSDVVAYDELLMMPSPASLTFLGREPVMYTECGFVGYRLGDQRVRAMLDDMRAYYTSGEMFTHPKSDWHDSRCFDICRKRSSIPDNRQISLVGKLTTTNVWRISPLARFSEHHKGPRRKQIAYGGNVP